LFKPFPNAGGGVVKTFRWLIEERSRSDNAAFLKARFWVADSGVE
jgi:hypothetical protein